MLFTPEKIDTSVVCPICLNPRCPLFLKLQGLKHAHEERRYLIQEFHKPVCMRCKRQRCRPFPVYIKCQDGGKMKLGLIDCFAKPAKKLSKKKRLPEWWT